MFRCVKLLLYGTADLWHVGTQHGRDKTADVSGEAGYTTGTGPEKYKTT